MPDERTTLLKSADIARLLQVHPKHIYRLLARGLPAHRVGSEWRFSRDEVLAWSGAALPHVDAASTAATRPATSTPTPSAPTSPPPLLSANGDLVVEVLIERLAIEAKPLVGLVQSDRGRALDQLAGKKILLAGFHGDVPPLHLGTARLARIHLVSREVGIAFDRSHKIRKLADLQKKRLGLRPPTAGVRSHFDRALASAKLTLPKLRCKTTTFESHREAACAVVRGQLDAALCTAAWAERVGLGFLSLASEAYDLLLYAEHLGTPASVAVCEVAQSRAFRAALSAIAGYDARHAGEIRYPR
jgi:putative molybdopterin biosynthesis protein